MRLHAGAEIDSSGPKRSTHTAKSDFFENSKGTGAKFSMKLLSFTYFSVFSFTRQLNMFDIGIEISPLRQRLNQRTMKVFSHRSALIGL